MMGEGTPSLSSLDADYVAAVTPSRIVVNDFASPDFPVRKFTFRATAANDKARELGWIV